MPPATISSVAEQIASTAAAKKAPCQPQTAAMASTMAGVTPEPKKPAKLWIENALPMRFSSMVADRME